jgi:putative thioredoxin
MTDEELEEIRKRKINEVLKKIVEGGNKMTEENKEVEIEAADEDFKEKVIEQSKTVPVVVDFFSDWCPPCQILGPILERLVKEYDGKFILAKVNVEGARQASEKYGVRSIPSVKMFKDGKIVDEFVGAIPESAVKEWLDKNLS